MVLHNRIPDKLMMTALLIFVIIGVSMLYIISIGSYFRYLELCESKKIKPLNFFEWIIYEDDRV